MTKLSAEQEALVQKIAARKRQFDKMKAQLELEFRVALDELKNPIREAVREASEAGVPTRQIHLRGLDFSQVNSMVSFLDHKTETLGEKTARILGVQTTTLDEDENGNIVATYRIEQPGLRVTEHKDTEWRVLDEDGDEWPVGVSYMGGKWVVINTFDFEDGGAVANPAAVREAIMNHKPGRVVWGVESLEEQ